MTEPLADTIARKTKEIEPYLTTTINDPEMVRIYSKVSEAFARRIEAMFESEDSLQAAYKARFPGLEFDRTDRWHLILAKELQDAWHEHGPVVKASVTPYDRNWILAILGELLDFNLFSQVLLNLQDWGLLRYRVADVEADTAKLQAKWARKSPSPFDAKAKMVKQASKPEDIDFNHDLSTLKSLRIIPKIAPGLSFRVTPKGSTPALVDSANLSMLGVGGDQYLLVPSSFKVAYITWETTPEVMTPTEDGKFRHDLIDYPFTSKSGGDTLNSVMAVRLLAAVLYKHLPISNPKVVLPRMTSIMVMTDADITLVENFADMVSQGWITDEAWPVTYHRDRRTP